MVPSAGLTTVVRAGKCWGGVGSPQDRSEGDRVAAKGVQAPVWSSGLHRGGGGRGWLKAKR